MNSNTEELYKEREERIKAAVGLKTPDRVPVICTEMDFSWKYNNISQLEFMTDNDKMMRAYERFYKDFQPDAAYSEPALFDSLFAVIGSPCLIKLPGRDLPENSVFQLVESEIMKEEDYKRAKRRGYILTLINLLPKLRPEIPDVQAKFNAMIQNQIGSELTELNRKKLKEWGIPIWSIGGMESPFSVLCLMRSYEKLVFDIYRNRELVKETVKKFTQDIIRISIGGCKPSGILRAQIGLHRESSSSFSLKIFEEIALPMIKEIVDAHIKEDIITILHCDGNWTPNLPYLAELPKGKCILDIDDSTDIYQARDLLGDRMCFSGNVMERLLTFGTPKKVEDHCKELIDVLGENGGYVMKGEAPAQAKPENIKAMINTAKTYGVYKA